VKHFVVFLLIYQQLDELSDTNGRTWRTAVTAENSSTLKEGGTSLSWATSTRPTH